MQAELREQFRLKLLQLIDTAGSLGFRVAAMHVHLAANGFECSRDDLACEVMYLADKSLIAPIDKILSPENHRWRITAAGRDFLASQGLA